MKVTILGIGMDGVNTITKEAENALKEAELLIGAKRMVESVACGYDIAFHYEIDSQKIVQKITESSYAHVVVIMSGDTGFYSGTNLLVKRLEETSSTLNIQVEVLCGITSVQYLASKIKRPWQKVHLESAHGIEANVIGTVMQYPESFFLTGGNITVSVLLEQLTKAGLGDAVAYIGEEMGYPTEKITCTTAKEGCERTYHSLAVVWIVRKELYLDSYSGRISDEEFIRGKVPITKEEVRTQIVSDIGRGLKEVIYDIGAGTGSIAIELALANPLSEIYAFEVNPEACQLIRENREKFGAYNVTLIEGPAPESMEGIPTATRVFVGGSKGNMKEILERVWSKEQNAYVVVSAIAVETFGQTIALFDELEIPDMEVTQIAISKTKVLGGYHMLMGQNPIFLISGGVKL